ncbi:monodechloroaminopyrrolnitrin synthase PrnB family protein [Streptomyces sp. NPDC001514]
MPITRLPHRTDPCDIRTVSALDPLRADSFYPRLPGINATADVPALVDALRRLLPDLDTVGSYSLPERLAAMRDLGLLLGSLKRHGTQPVEAVPEAEPILVELGRSTGMVPRDTVHHYTEWNPTNFRRRMYTGDKMEGFLMDGARLSLPHVADAVDLCSLLYDADPADQETAQLLDQVDRSVSIFDELITMVTEKVTPEFFAQQVRPYYEDITVDGRSYFGPAAAHVPLFLVDMVIWASDRGDPVYDAFIDEVAPHTLPQWRALLAGWSNGPSLVTKVEAALTEAGVGDAAAGAPPPQLLDTARSLAAVLRTLTVFRGKHLTIARKAYRDEVRLYELGSGNGSITLLHQILALTKENVTLVRWRAAAPAAREAVHG